MSRRDKIIFLLWIMQAEMKLKSEDFVGSTHHEKIILSRCDKF